MFTQVQRRTYIVILTAQTDLGLRSRTFSLKINKLPTFSEINQGCQCLKIVFIQTDELNFNFTLDLCSKPQIDPTFEYKDLYYKPQNHSTMTT